MSTFQVQGTAERIDRNRRLPVTSNRGADPALRRHYFSGQ
jgi:hypothetical protein